MATWDGLRAGTGVPLRLHANAGYLYQRDESRFLLDRAPLALDLPAPNGERDNDVLTLAGAAELDLSRVTLFGEIATDQFVNERSLLKGKENRIAVTPGIRLWIPGGLSIAGAYTINLSKDNPATSFNPDHAFPDREWRLALSLGTVFRSASAKAEDAVAMVPLAVPAPLVDDEVAPSPADSVKVAKAAKEKEIIERRPIQEAPAPPKAVTPAPAAQEDAVTGVPGAHVAPPPAVAPTSGTAVSPAPSSPRQAPAPKTLKYVDTDGDGIPDSDDRCPLLAEDWDGFQDFDGCPDLDNDRDGIPDIRDQCPNDPETYNGYYDFDGCPDVAPDTRKSMASPEAPAPTSAAPAPPATTRPGAAAANSAAAASSAPGGAADSLRRTLAVEQGRNAELLAQLIRAEQARAAADATPSPRPDPMLARDLQMQYELDAERRRSADLESRIRAVESTNRSPVVIERSVPAPAPAATSPGSAPLSQNNATRLQALEQELAGLRASTAAEANLSLPIPAPQPVDTTGQRILSQLSSIQISMAEIAAQESTPTLEPTADVMKTLDLMLPLGTTRVFPEIQFESGSAQLQRGALQALDTMAGVLRLAPDARVDVVGHTDNVGRARANLLLSQERARAVAEALTLRGVSPAQLSVVGRGETMSMASNATAAGREANRRVEFTRSR
jgi:outer membrane protein OmpA-like peptidoglycan-associated protein